MIFARSEALCGRSSALKRVASMAIGHGATRSRNRTIPRRARLSVRCSNPAHSLQGTRASRIVPVVASEPPSTSHYVRAAVGVNQNSIWCSLNRSFRSARVDSFACSFFLSHVHFSEQRVNLTIEPSPSAGPWRPPCANSLLSRLPSQSCLLEGFSPVARKLGELKPRHSLRRR